MLAGGSDIRNFRIIRTLGQGGFGITYLVQDTILFKDFAMKEYFPRDFALRSGASISPLSDQVDNFIWGKERFLDEARTLARFTHPNIVGVNQIFEENNTAYIILDYQSGRSFSAWLEEVILPSQEDLDLIVKPLISAFQLIHKNNLLHRDIAPDNIFIRDDGSPVLLDFGSAREAFALKTKAVSAIVKTGFSPPEQYSTRGTGQGPWTDIYAFAATLYLAVSGVTPDEATDRLLDDQLLPLREIASSAYRSSFLEAIDHALKIKPKDRPQSIDEWQIHLFDSRPTLALDRAPKVSIESTEPIVVMQAENKSAFPVYRLAFVFILFLLVFAIVLLSQSSKPRIPISSATNPDTFALSTSRSDSAITNDRLNTINPPKMDQNPNDLVPKRVQTQSVGPTANAPSGTAPTRSSATFPPPVPVKTVQVRPDGTIISSLGSASGPTELPKPSDTASGSPRDLNNNVPTPPRRSVQDLLSDRPTSSLVDPLPRPSETTTLPAVPMGEFAVQFGAAGSETEARDRMARLQRQYASALSGKYPSVTKNEANGKEVYRIRVGGLSRDEATAMCLKIKDAGGSCFVAIASEQDLLSRPPLGTSDAPPKVTARMTSSVQDEIDLFMQEKYKKCWIYTVKNAPDYIAQIKVEYSVDGTLVGSPILLNPSNDPQQKIISDSAMKAVQSCDPLRIPTQFQQYHQEWKSRILRFDPKTKIDTPSTKARIEYEDKGVDTSISVKDIRDGKVKQSFDGRF